MKNPRKVPQMSEVCDRVIVSQKKGNTKWTRCVFIARACSQAIL